MRGEMSKLSEIGIKIQKQENTRRLSESIRSQIPLIFQVSKRN